LGLRRFHSPFKETEVMALFYDVGGGGDLNARSLCTTAKQCTYFEVL
jgi:hypothetical protein